MGKENEVELSKKVKEIIQTKPRIMPAFIPVCLFFIFKDY